MKSGHELIRAKRERQISKHKYNYTHDLTHTPSQFINAANAYISGRVELWPFDNASFKLGDRIENLTNAGAMIAAALDRINSYEVGKVYKSGSCMQPGTFKVIKIKSLKTHTDIYFIGLSGDLSPKKQSFMIGSIFDQLATSI